MTFTVGLSSESGKASPFRSRSPEQYFCVFPEGAESCRQMVPGRAMGSQVRVGSADGQYQPLPGSTVVPVCWIGTSDDSYAAASAALSNMMFVMSLGA